MLLKLTSLLLFFLVSTSMTDCAQSKTVNDYQYPVALDNQNLSKAYFASGCFWCVEAVFESVIGVQEVVSGYSGGDNKSANYEDVSSGSTGHAETVEVHYNPAVVSYETLLKVFFGSHDPTTKDRQGPDAGSQYRSAIFYTSAEEKKAAELYIQKLYETGEYKAGTITTQVEAFKAFYAAESYHQDYEKLNPNEPYVRGVSVPRLKRFQSRYPELVKKENKH